MKKSLKDFEKIEGSNMIRISENDLLEMKYKKADDILKEGDLMKISSNIFALLSQADVKATKINADKKTKLFTFYRK